MPFCYEQTSPLGVLSTPSGNPKQALAQFVHSEKFFLFPIKKDAEASFFSEVLT